MVRIFSAGRKPNADIFNKNDALPEVSVLIPAYNEEGVIAQKIESVLASDYPHKKVQVIVGSDASTDRTNETVKALAKKFPFVRLEELNSRRGKAAVVNRLVPLANDLIILTDANVIFEKNTVYDLVKHFKNSKVGLVDSHMKHVGLRKEGISMQERTYIRSEVAIKYAESILWGTMMGPFGGCFAFRKSLFEPIPAHFLVDDFFVNMKVLDKGGRAINDLQAVVYEDVSNDLAEEFRRKIRIATGSFQNFFAFLHLLFRFNGLSFSFFSHKVLRWFGPLFIILLYCSNIFLLNQSMLPLPYPILFLLLNIFLFAPLLDFVLKKFGIHLFLLRLITHFLAMNFALLIGFFRYLSGVRTGIWTPTKRNQ